MCPAAQASAAGQGLAPCDLPHNPDWPWGTQPPTPIRTVQLLWVCVGVESGFWNYHKKKPFVLHFDC